MRKKLENGELDERMIEFDSTQPAVGMQVLGPAGFDDMGINIQEIKVGRQLRRIKCIHCFEEWNAIPLKNLIPVDYPRTSRSYNFAPQAKIFRGLVMPV